MNNDDTLRISRSWSSPRRVVAATAALVVGSVWTHGLAAVLRAVGPQDAPLASLGLTLAALAAAALGAWSLPRRGAEWLAAIGGVLAAACVVANAPGAWAASLAIPIVAAAATRGARWLGERLPARVDAAPSTQRLLALAWCVVALLCVAQTARLSTHMTDREIGFTLTTQHPFWYGHECIGAYLLGADLAAQGEENIYDACHFAALDREASPSTSLEGVALDDPYQYPPPFLVLPGAAMAITDDVGTLRVVWFALQWTLFVLIAASVARWIGGAEGRVALWLLPALLASFPVLMNFQFGQFHLIAVALGVLAMRMFDRGRHVLGGSMLGFAIVSKIFPAVLLALLVGQRRFKEIAWTGAAMAALCGIALAAYGPAPFEAFVDYQLPRLADGSAFAFDEAWPELADLLVVDNQGLYGLAQKLGAGKPYARDVAKLFGAALFVVAFVIGIRRGSPRSRFLRAATWLALLGLASLASPGAWGDYVPTTAVWLLSLVAVPMTRTPARALAFGAACVLEVFVLGTMPIGTWVPLTAMTVVSACGVLAMLALFGGTLVVRPREARRRNVVPTRWPLFETASGDFY